MDHGQMIEFWKQVVAETKSVNDPVFLDYLQSIDANRVWSDAGDENLKSFLSTINRLSNEPKSRSLGLTLLNQFIEQVKATRFVVIQEGLSSALHIAVKYIDQELVQKLFVNLLPRSQKALELNQILSSSVIPKILTHLSSLRQNETKRLLSLGEIHLLRICLEHFHGPCGNHRANFEKMLLPYIDSDNEIERGPIFKILPLLSSTGSGGNKRSKHGQDWYGMNVKILHSMQETVFRLYSDATPSLEEYNPYETEFGVLALPAINEKNVFLRYSLLKTRLINLATLLGYYLSEPYPVAKPVPSKSILNIVCKMLLLNPVDLLNKKASQEFIYLAGILPAIHESALRLVNNLIDCVEQNLLPESERIEQLSLQELKWLSKTPRSFQKLKICMYQMLLKWLKVTNGFVASSKTMNVWFDQIRNDTSIEKSSTTLTLKCKSKTGGKKKASQPQSLSKILTSSDTTTIDKDSNLCAESLTFLEALIPNLDGGLHRAAYQLVAKTIMEFFQEPMPSTPFNEEVCRVKIFQCVLCFVFNPHPKSPVSLGILQNLVRQGLTDSSLSVQNICHALLSSLEKIVHPAVPSFDFPPVFNPASNEQDTVVASDDYPITSESVDTRDNFCQTEDAELPKLATPMSVSHSFNPASIADEGSSIPASLTRTIQSTIRKEIQELFAELPHHFQRVNESDFQDDHTSAEPEPRFSSSSIKLVNGHGKRPADGIVGYDEAGTNQQEKVKKLRTDANEKTDEIGTDCLEWLNDFVDKSPIRE